MEPPDDYVSGRQHYWFQFAGGFVVGAILGFYLSRRFHGSNTVKLFVTAVCALSFAFYCGRCADRAWRTISDWLQTWRR